MNEISVVSLNGKCHLLEGKIKRMARRFLQLLKKENCRLEIFLITSRKIKFLNKKFRNKDKATDILTFVEPKNYPHPESKLKFLGEIYLNPDYIAPENLSRLVAHGLLHLFGFFHKKKSDRIKM
ncbi:MAG: rRNA maturation RNase YbeY, partial [bacterium]|nr:rRNA maturation RNase YbeY [bacterium]